MDEDGGDVPGDCAMVLGRDYYIFQPTYNRRDYYIQPTNAGLIPQTTGEGLRAKTRWGGGGSSRQMVFTPLNMV